MGKQPGLEKEPALHLSVGQRDSRGVSARTVRVLAACRLQTSRSKSHKVKVKHCTVE